MAILVRQKSAGGDKSTFWQTSGIVVSWLLAIVSLYFTSENISETKKWQKNQFIATQFEKFNSCFAVGLMNKVLDYDAREMALDSGSQKILVTRDLIAVYLVDSLYDASVMGETDKAKIKKNVEVKARIRDIMDDYLDKLSLFNRYYKSGLVTREDIRPYLEYQIKRIADTTTRNGHLRNLQRSIWYFAGVYNFNDIPELCQLFGYKIAVPPPME